MAGIKTTELPILEEAPNDSDVVYIVDVSENVSKQISIADLFSGVEEPGLNSDEVTSLINEDYINQRAPAPIGLTAEEITQIVDRDYIASRIFGRSVIGSTESMTIYTSLQGLPLFDNNYGDLAYVSTNHRLYIWDSAGWYTVAEIDTSMNVVGGEGSFTINEDSEISFSINSNSNNPITYGYVLDDSDDIATISQVDNQYTIGASDFGSFRVALTANDQVNLVRDLANINVEISERREYFLHDGTNEPAQIITQHGNILLTESSI